MDSNKPFPSCKDLERCMEFNIIRNLVSTTHKCAICNGNIALVSLDEECCGNSSCSNLSRLVGVDLNQFSIENVYVCLPCKFILDKILELKMLLRQILSVGDVSHREVATFPGNKFHMIDFWANSKPPCYMHFVDKLLKTSKLSLQSEGSVEAEAASAAAVALLTPKTLFDYYKQNHHDYIYHLLKCLDEDDDTSEDDSESSRFSDIEEEDEEEEAAAAAAPLLANLGTCRQHEEDVLLEKEKLYVNELEQAEGDEMDITKYIFPPNEDDSEVIRIPAAVIEYYSQMKQKLQRDNSEQVRRFQDPVEYLFLSDDVEEVSAINVGEQGIQDNNFEQYGGMSGVDRNYVLLSNESEGEVAVRETMKTVNWEQKHHADSEGSQNEGLSQDTDVLDEDERCFSLLSLKKALEE